MWCGVRLGRGGSDLGEVIGQQHVAVTPIYLIVLLLIPGQRVLRREIRENNTQHSLVLVMSITFSYLNTLNAIEQRRINIPKSKLTILLQRTA